MNKVVRFIVLFLFFSEVVYPQDNEYKFVIRKEVPSTPVKNQSTTSTCWSFSGLSFFESELIRMGHKPIDLSEMFIVKEAYKRKAEEYARQKGSCAFSSGGQYYDLLLITRENGLVPESVFSGLKYGQKYHNHDEMDSALKGYMKGVLKGSMKSPAWMEGLNGILEAYLGKMDQGFYYEGKYYSPESFSKEMGLDFNDYIIVSSFSDHPYYKENILEVPDNWAPCTYYNLPLNELIEVIDNSIMNGYSVAWASDMRGKGFSMKKGVALVPDKSWDSLSDDEFEDFFDRPHPQKMVTQELRQNEFEGFSITGDHGMHIIGIAEDQNGNIFYKVKNSWGKTGKYDGYIFVSREYIKLKTTNCMINKNALPEAIAYKLGFNDNWEGKPLAEDASHKNTSPDNQPAFIQAPAKAE